jgi:hypothetical protein
MIFDDSEVCWNEDGFVKHVWSQFYHNVAEQISPNAPRPRVNSL